MGLDNNKDIFLVLMRVGRNVLFIFDQKGTEMPKLKQQSGRQKIQERPINRSRLGHIQVVKEERRGPYNSEANHQYNEEGLMYANELFNKNIHKLIWTMSRQTYIKEGLPFLKRYPVIKMLTFLSKKLFLNGLELVFMQYILEENKWDIHDEAIARSAPAIKDFMNSTDVGNQKEYKCFMLYLTLIAYSAKYYLNDTDRIEMFGKELNEIIPEFQTVFKEWSKRNQAVTAKISPKLLNSIFRRLNSKDNKINYLMMVQQIIHISPPYNNNQSEKKAKVKKDRTVMETANARVMREESESVMDPQNIPTMQEYQLPELLQQPSLFRQGTSMDGPFDIIQRNIR